MIGHEVVGTPRYIYPPDDWRMLQKQFSPGFLAQDETLFSTANGYLGIRGAFEEGSPAFHNGTFINGFFESWPIIYGENAYGFAKTGQTILNVTDAKTIRLYVDDEPFYLPTANLLKFERCLDMRAGALDREVLWETASGRQVLIQSRRLVSFQERHLAALSYRVTVLNDRVAVVLSSELSIDAQHQAQTNDGDPRRARHFSGRVVQAEKAYGRDLRMVLSHRTRSSGMTLACGIDHEIETVCHYSTESRCSGDSGTLVLAVDAQPRQPIQLTKFLTYHSSRRSPAEELCERSERTLDRARAHGFETLMAGQREYLDDFWQRSDVQVGAAVHPKAQQCVRWNLFQLLQATARAEGAGVPAKGLTGQMYEGHYFWDCEIYVLPYLIYTAPRIAKNLLKFRHSMLDKARQRARDMNQKGALFPWRTINGEEASAFYAAGTAQYHINADIIYGLRKYVEVTGDTAFLHAEGAEMLVETARLWYDLGFFSNEKDGRFCIHGVTGPDEYNTVVNNNTYTNLMARENLLYAAKTVETVMQHHPERCAVLVDRTALRRSEVDDWKAAAKRMYIPYDLGKGIHPQDDSFLEKEVWDLANTPPDRFPLLLNYHPLVIYRYQVIKQADVVLAMFLLGREFSTTQKKRNFDYCDPLTTGDSSLSACIQSIVAAEIGYEDKALGYLRRAALMDLADVGGNVRDGCHIASMGGTWMALVYGLAGMRDYDGHLTFDPAPLASLDGAGKDGRLAFTLTVRGQVLYVGMEDDSVTYCLRHGSRLAISHRGDKLDLTARKPVIMPRL